MEHLGEKSETIIFVLSKEKMDEEQQTGKADKKSEGIN